MSYFIEVPDMNGKIVKVEVSAEVHGVFEDERKQKERERNEKRRHGTYVPLDEVLKTKSDESSLDERLIASEKLEKTLAIISTCSEIQQKRFFLNRISGLSFVAIAEMEQCTEGAIRHSVNYVSKKIKKFLELGTD